MKGTKMKLCRLSTFEQQLAMAMLAHAARHDDDALAASLSLLTEPAHNVHPVCVITALVKEFQRGMNRGDCVALARRFSDEALALAAADTAEREGLS
ncbi:hypothetical protein [Nocardia sp. NPDC052566]|uniref:hypothetical protein n=1 Tax=Nocardia sp. NPDC052566 TaxID=3364330 RepID=UPI0037CC57C9